MLLAAVSPSLMAGNIIRLSDGAILPGEPSPPVRTVVRSGPYTEVTYEFESYAVEPSADCPGSMLVTVPLFQVNHSQGEPAYLFKTDALNVNDTTDVAIEIVDTQYTDLRLKLSPAPTLQIAKECYSTEVTTDGPGNYSVTLIDNGNIIESQKIQIR